MTRPAGVSSITPVTVVADALIADQQGRILLTQPTYRPDWVPPGGDVEAGETPEQACAREVAEEIGVRVVPARLLVVDWLPTHRYRAEPMVYFLFDCGQVPDDVAIRLANGEVRECAFLSLAQALPLMTPGTGARVTAAMRARTGVAPTYLPDTRE
ncbi:NUDIX hydrolase [Micromonospora sp. WMMD812]|uniref:NUDIX domain-containing protein n=1 Tax=Micromonospora sp. WMMD812 TaxID=3015152 RepID=UPI00248AAC63|nr:NUDIX hydrolase [Micromonospora sp. WMMD812]WBB67786.1 NUDIX hydrolase [Micromonospora sp. WMMD812]